MDCQSCGIPISESAAVATVERSFRTSKLILCQNCRRQQQRRTEHIVALIGLLIAPLAAFIGTENPFLTIALLTVPFQLISLPIHELGHAIVGWVVGVEVMQISIGRGRRFAKLWVGGVLVELHRIPFSGYVRGICVKEGYRWRTACFLLGGIFGNGLLLSFAGFMLVREMPSIMPNQWNWSMLIYAALAFANLLQLLSNLMPRKTLGISGASDGKQLLQLLKQPVPTRKAREMQTVLTRTSMQCIGNRTSQAREYLIRELKNHPDDVHLLMQMGFIQIKDREFQSAVGIYQSLLNSPAVDAPLRAMLLNNLAWAHLMADDSDQLELADACSAEAILIQSCVPIFRGTRGSVLVVRGENELGLQLLKQAMIGADNDASRASGAAFTALAHHQIGDLPAANRWISKARELDADNEVIPFVQKRMSGLDSNPEAPGTSDPGG